MSKRGSDKESTLSAEHDGNKTLFPPNASTNYECLSLVHGLLSIFFPFCVCVEEQDRLGKDNMPSLSWRLLESLIC